MGSLRDIARALEISAALEGRTQGLEDLHSSEVETFYNKSHDKATGRFGTRPGGGFHTVSVGGRKYSAQEVEKSLRDEGNHLINPQQRHAERSAKLKKAALIVVGVAIAVGVVFLGVKVNQGVQAEKASVLRAKQHEIPGTRLHYTRRWSDKDSQGRGLHVLDSSGKLTDKQAQGMLKQLKETSNRHPVEGRAVKIVVRDQHKNVDPGMKAFVVPVPGTRTINVNYKHAFGSSPSSQLNNAATRIVPWFSKIERDKNGRHGGDPSKYTVAHEYGHVFDLENQRKSEVKDVLSGVKREMAGSGYATKRGSAHSDNKAKLKLYGQSNPYEGYAESFAEWDLSGGKTKNEAARDYAKQFDWRS